jgi:hypothetical protein
MPDANIPDFITKFVEAVYPDAPWLAMAMFDEGTCLRDATELIATLRARVAELEKELAEANGKLAEIHETFYGGGYELAHWHLNGDLEPIDSFFESNDWEPTRVAELEGKK